MKFRISLGKGFFPLPFSSFLIVLFLAGCVENSSILDNGKSRQLEFSVTTHNWSDSANSNKSSGQKIPSRATPISTFDTSKNFNVIADVNKGGSWSTEVNNETVSYSTTDNIWQTTTTHYWPGTGSTINFYAYYPTSISSDITHTTGLAPVFSYTVPDNASDQIDILASSKTGIAGNSYNQTPVDFKHILSAIQFSVGSGGMINGTITRISLNGIQNTGSYSFTGGWTPQTSSTTTYTKNVLAASNAGTEIVSGNDPFLVMPQTLSNVSFTVTYSGGATLTKSLNGTWEAGKVYDYNINSSFSATQDFNYTGDIQTYTVPFTGIYKLEVWGAQGGYYGGGYGGYSYGNIKLNQNALLYICVGGTGIVNVNGSQVSNPLSAGYNGGGYGQIGGGGATHIALTNKGVLRNYISSQDEVLIVAGGGGGMDCDSNYSSSGGSGGGLNGGDAVNNELKGGSGGTQTSGGIGIGSGSFGQGGDIGTTNGDSAGGGGGGWYGGGSSSSPTIGSGGGGSGHFNSTLISGTTGMQNGIRAGNGYARITFVSAD